MTTGWNVLGVDPAPRKDTVICRGSTFVTVEAVGLPRHLREELNRNPRSLIAWDAPLAFARTNFYDRDIDRATREWVGGLKPSEVESKAVNPCEFARLSHWAVTCESIGLPFGSPPNDLKVASGIPGEGEQGPLVIEVHPAVALLAWWRDKSVKEPFPAYKGSKSKKDAAAYIAAALSFPKVAGHDHDHLDAFAAFRLGRMFLKGEARWVGDPMVGGYVLPNGPTAVAIQKLL